MKQYNVRVKWRGNPDKWVYVGGLHPIKSIEEARAILERQLENKDHQFDAGGMGVTVKHYSEYDVIEAEIVQREVTPWEAI